MPSFSAQPLLGSVRTDSKLPTSEDSVPLFSDVPHWGALLSGRIIAGNPAEPGWAPQSGQLGRPQDSLIVFPLSGVLALPIGGQHTKVAPGSFIMMPHGQYEPVRCLEDPTHYGVLHLAPAARFGSVSSLSRQRFVALGAALAGYRPRQFRDIFTEVLLRPGQIPGLNGAKHHLISTDASLPPSKPSPSHIVLFCLSGRLRIACRKKGVDDSGTLEAGGRVIMGPYTGFSLKNKAPNRKPASVLQINFSSNEPIR